MKKLIIVLLTITAFASCKKDSLKNCKCGIVTDDVIENVDDYTLTIKNDCSNNSKKFYVNVSTWMDGVVGEKFCMTEIW